MKIRLFHATSAIAGSVVTLAAFPAFMLLAAACSEPPRDSAPAKIVDDRPNKAPDATGLPRPGEGGCPVDGTWRECGLVERLVRTGVAPKPTSDTVRFSWMSVPGVRIAIGRSALLTAFYYPSEEDAIRDEARIDTVRVSAPWDTTKVWQDTPHYIRSGNLIAVLESGNPRQVERILLAIGAGAP